MILSGVKDYSKPAGQCLGRSSHKLVAPRQVNTSWILVDSGKESTKTILPEVQPRNLAVCLI